MSADRSPDTFGIEYETVEVAGGMLSVRMDGLVFERPPGRVLWSAHVEEVLDWRLRDDGTVLVVGRETAEEIDVATGSEGPRPDLSPTRDPGVRERMAARTTWRRRMGMHPKGPSTVVSGTIGKRIWRFDSPDGRTVHADAGYFGGTPDAFEWSGGVYVLADDVVARLGPDLSVEWEKRTSFVGSDIFEAFPDGDGIVAVAAEEAFSLAPDGTVRWETGVVGCVADWRVDAEGLVLVLDDDTTKRAGPLLPFS